MPLAIGLMSGTSRDGMDAALIASDGLNQIRCGASLTLPYQPAFANKLAELCALGKQAFQPSAQSLIKPIAAQLTDYARQAVSALLQAEKGLASHSVAVLGFHGHTINHAPKIGRTLQIGDGARLAKETAIAVVDDFRSCDLACGGQGAPLAPLYHLAIARCLRQRDPSLELEPVVFLNIGGIANVTWIAARGEAEVKGSMLAFDAGPGNALLDDWVLAHSEQAAGQTFDRDGAFALRGRCHSALLRELLHASFFAEKPPKSLDREQFSLKPLAELSLEDGAKTLTVFLAETLRLASDLFPKPAGLWLLCGGGRKNPAIVEVLQQRLFGRVRLIDEVGFDGDALEAQAFGYLAIRRLNGQPTAYPQLTGAREATCGGRLHEVGVPSRSAG